MKLYYGQLVIKCKLKDVDCIEEQIRAELEGWTTFHDLILVDHNRND